MSDEVEGVEPLGVTQRWICAVRDQEMKDVEMAVPTPKRERR